MPVYSNGFVLIADETRAVFSVEAAASYWCGRSLNAAQDANAVSESLFAQDNVMGQGFAHDGSMMFADLKGGEPTETVWWANQFPYYADGRLVVDSVGAFAQWQSQAPRNALGYVTIMPMAGPLPPDPRLPGTPELVSVTAGVAEFTLSISETDKGYPSLTSFYYELYVHGVKQAQIIGVKPADGAGPLYTVVLPVVNPLLLECPVDIRVKAESVDGRSALSNMLTSTTLAPPITVPDAPILNSAVFADGFITLDVTLTGDGGSALIGWYFESFIAGTDTPAINSKLIAIATLSYSFGDKGFTAGVAYDFLVIVRNAIGDSLPSNKVEADFALPPVVPTVPAQPVIVSLNPNTKGFAPVVRVADNGNSLVTSLYYEIYKAGTTNVQVQGSKPASGSGPDYTIALIINNPSLLGVPLDIVVYADNAVGRSPASLPMTGQTL